MKLKIDTEEETAEKLAVRFLDICTGLPASVTVLALLVAAARRLVTYDDLPRADAAYVLRRAVDALLKVQRPEIS